MDEIVYIKSEFIKLGQLLKLSGLADRGSDAKMLIADGYVLVNGEPALERGRKVYPGDKVELKGVGAVVVELENE